MARDGAQEDRLADLRKRAEAGREREPADVPDMSTDELRTLVHDLQTHRIELEMQNEELRRTQEELVESRDRYSKLYDFAPVGYVTVSDKGMIIEANLTLATMLGVDRGALVGHPLSAFVAREDQDVLYLYRKKVLGSHGRETCQVRMRRPDAGPIWTEMDTTRIEADDGGRFSIPRGRQRRHRATAGGGVALGDGDTRHPHGAHQPSRVRAAAGARAGVGPRAARRARALLYGPGPVQGRQRYVRPRGGGHALASTH